MKIYKYAAIFLALFLFGCARADVDLRNAPVASGNFNSRLAEFGQVFLWDRQSNTLNSVATFKDAGSTVVVEQTKSSVEERMGRGISIEFTGVNDGLQASATASIRSSSSFTITNYGARRFRFAGHDVLNGDEAEIVNWRSHQGDYASDRYRYVLVYRVIAADDVTLKWNGEDADGVKTQLNIGGTKIDVDFSNKSLARCTGSDKPCIIETQILGLRPNPDPKGATGLEFFLDTSLDAAIVVRDLF